MAQSDRKKDVLRIYLEMIRDPCPDKEENLSELGLKFVGAQGECVVDGIFQPNMTGSFMKHKEIQVLIQSLQQTTICLENIKPARRRACMHNSTSDTITIYYYITNIEDELKKGVPVVLNISNSNKFLKCTFIEDKAVLTVECCEKDKLNSIYKNDPTTWPFVFYLSQMKDNCRRFESAQCIGWFIRTKSDTVCMDKYKEKDSENVSFNVYPIQNEHKLI